MQSSSHSPRPRLSLAFGHLLLWSGFLLAAFCSVVRRELPEKWSTIPWGWYLLALAAGFVGVVLIRQSRSHADSDEAKTDAEYSVVRKSLDHVSTLIGQLSADKDRTPSEVLRCIDENCVEPLAEFVESRQALVKRFGLAVYAEVMTEFASAERLINRSWSAAADGYVDEVSASLKRADQHLRRAKELLAAAESASTVEMA